jgi:two-component system, OmpR family, KDP operon response regulator KdpE
VTTGRAEGAGVRVLVVDDEPQILRALAVNLRVRGYAVDTAEDGESALALASHGRPDVVILDLGLPGIDGEEVIAGLRGWSEVPIVVLSARGTEEAKVAALDAGADDYVTKPFGMAELLARVRAAVRRTATPTAGLPSPVVETEHFRIDLEARTVTRDGTRVRLTPIEWQLLALLARNPGRLVTHRQLLTDVWGPGFERETGYLRVHLGHIRRKLEPEPSRPRYLLTEPGMGYRLVTDASVR